MTETQTARPSLLIRIALIEGETSFQVIEEGAQHVVKIFDDLMSAQDWTRHPTCTIEQGCRDFGGESIYFRCGRDLSARILTYSEEQAAWDRHYAANPYLTDRERKLAEQNIGFNCEWVCDGHAADMRTSIAADRYAEIREDSPLT